MKRYTSKITGKISLAAALLLGLATLAQADSFYYTSTNSTGWQNLGFGPTSLYLPQFNAALGTLNSVRLYLSASEQSGVTIENGASSSASISISLAGVIQATDGTLNVMNNMSTVFGPYSLAANENSPGLPVYNQSGPDFLDLGSPGSTQSGYYTASTGNGDDLSPYIGLGTYAIQVTGSGGWSASGSTAYSLNINAFVGEGTIYARYGYTPVSVPEPSSALFLGLGGLALALRRRFTR